MSATLSSTAIGLICLSYLLGSLSSAVVLSRLMHLPDPRKQGSGNPGATNMLRSGNRLAALMTLLLDTLKGGAPILVADALDQPQFALQLMALAVVIGHIVPIFIRFRGGKGVATTLGVTLALTPLIGLLALATWLLTLLSLRISALAGLTMALLLPVYTLWLDPGQFWLIITLAVLIALRHRENIQRYLKGDEHRF